LLQAILRLRGDAELRRRFGAAGAAIAAQYTASSMCEKYLAIYRKALSQPVGQ
jgi:glycosyltransferase involved in cell wall biosynthesis